MFLKRLVNVSAEVARAVKNGEPVVALESAIITHGMPWPKNFEVATKVESIIRQRNAIPATIGIIGGNIHVGLTTDQIQFMSEKSQTHPHKFAKVSRRDFPYVLSKNLHGGTTVSGTMIVAQKAGIPIFVTGGIGGVHRGAETSMDVSADLTELGKTPVAVISAGVKSILDIGKTLEYLETEGVFVGSFGEKGEFPAFFTSKSGFMAPYHVRSTEEASEMIYRNQLMCSNSGMLFCVPIPAEFSLDSAKIEAEIKLALKECQEKQVSGKNITPFLLQRIHEHTKGGSLAANSALVENNAKCGADIAVHLSHIKATQGAFEPPEQVSGSIKETQSQSSRPAVIGGSNFDFVVRSVEKNLRLDGSTNSGHIRSSFGGVGRNIADVLACLGADPVFISSVGNDTLGQSILRHNRHLDKSFISRNDSPTSSYCVVLDCDGQVKLGVGDMNQQVTPQHVIKHISTIRKSPLLVMDANLPQDTVNFVLEECDGSNIPVFFEPTDKYKSLSVLQSPHLKSIVYASPNLAELRALAGSTVLDDAYDTRSLKDVLDECTELSRSLVENIPFLLITLGDKGVLVVRRGQPDDPLPLRNAAYLRKIKTVSAKHYPVPRMESVVSVVGAGDCLTGAFIASLLRGSNQDVAISVGIQAARLSLSNENNVPFDLDQGKIQWQTIISNGKQLF